jgi:hypothetical protein
MPPLVQEISSAIHYLPCFWGGFLLCLPFLWCVCPFSGVFALSLVCLPFLWCTFSTPTTSAVVLDYNLLFVIQFCLGGCQSAQGLCWFMFPVVAGGVLCGLWCSPVCSVKWCWGRFGAGGAAVRNGSKFSQCLSAYLINHILWNKFVTCVPWWTCTWLSQKPNSRIPGSLVMHMCNFT